MAWTRTYDDAEPQRVNRWLAQSGVCSRREAEALITRGLVSIDGETVEDVGRKILPGQTLVLAQACRHPALTGNLGNIALLGIAAGLGLIDRDVAARCQAAYREFRRMQHALRLQGEKFARVPPEQARAHEEAVRELWKAVFRG